jgi:hypothetical protein
MVSSGGTITITGNSTLEIQAFYNSGNSNLVTATYTIGPPPVASDTPTLPIWGLIFMAALLLFFGVRQREQVR